jgi:hypothetical protein
VLFSAPSNILFSQTKTIRDAGGKRFTIPESSFSLENETHVRAKVVNHRGLSRTPQTLFPNSLVSPSAMAEDGRAAKGLAKREKGFNLGWLLKAAVGTVATVVIPASVLAGATLALRFVSRAIGATCAPGKGSERLGKADRESAENRLRTILSASLVGAATMAIRNPLLLPPSSKGSAMLSALMLSKNRPALENLVRNNKIRENGFAKEFTHYKEKFAEEAKDDEYIAAIYLIDENGAKNFGHVAMGLLKGDGRMDVVSFAADPDLIGRIVLGEAVPGRLFKGNYSFDEIVSGTEKIILERKDREYEKDAPPISVEEGYTNFIWIGISNEQGRTMEGKVDEIYNDVEEEYEYSLYEKNCNYVVQEILESAGLNFSPTLGDAQDERVLFLSLLQHTPLGFAMEPVPEMKEISVRKASDVPAATGIPALAGVALAEDLKSGTIPRAVYLYATTVGEAPEAKVIGRIPKDEALNVGSSDDKNSRKTNGEADSDGNAEHKHR